jgi:hypothetical protein
MMIEGTDPETGESIDQMLPGAVRERVCV